MILSHSLRLKNWNFLRKAKIDKKRERERELSEKKGEWGKEKKEKMDKSQQEALNVAIVCCKKHMQNSQMDCKMTLAA